ncbi:hypothetical protein H112_04503 [Trichophyton rubrum D6]|uniref:Uncharacterized protein n=1 Tax=Trichophyton soudanense CBS 452.61 TaxID=1215331 RepID=A0A022XSD8_TRISD|nr:hypothetical protein H102_04497 [Trichophyton rubrum CBS 100081]EZF63132.1 hypothetical protein H104_04493 [Trichophyton rubrum CBS 289.86]EZF73439.1 hypothetical protein H105_04519 [Trichophyton soudanense CBS 452.61]EZF84320.1 hypothetical protein H110_04495 [Trichophyton rubrum MR1448]EZG16585.1 hypothetical protein H107_04627 [Trichophyton rubrum CBS 202.88]KDB33504.1 hypothetical protein H112_04503 [Trichophyton rubrum D6]
MSSSTSFKKGPDQTEEAKLTCYRGRFDDDLTWRIGSRDAAAEACDGELRCCSFACASHIRIHAAGESEAQDGL